MIARYLIATMIFVSSSGLVHAQTRTDVKAGGRLAQTYCAACHAIGATQASPRPEAPAFRTLSDRYPIEGLEEALGEGILVGHTDMPQVIFSERGVRQMIAYLKSLQPMRPHLDK